MADATDTKATGGSSKRTAAIATIITLVVLALVGGGLAYGLHARQEQEAQQAREKAVASLCEPVGRGGRAEKECVHNTHLNHYHLGNGW